MKNFIVYAIWTFISAALLKSGIDIISGTKVGYLPVIILTVFTHVTIVFPIMVSVNALFARYENR